MSKNIIICCDGTGNEYDRNNTNVVHLYELLVRDQEQFAFYDPGVGTFSFLGRNLGRKFGILLGKVFGTGLKQNIEDCYLYLMDRLAWPDAPAARAWLVISSNFAGSY